MKSSIAAFFIFISFAAFGQRGDFFTVMKKYDPDPDLPIDPLPVFPGDISAYFNENIKYPPRAYKKKIEGFVRINYAVKTDGHAGNVNVLLGLGYGCDQEAVRLVKEMPKWEPGQQNGKPVNTYYTLDVWFMYPEDSASLSKDRLPSFPGDIKRYLYYNMSFPKEALKNNVNGKVFVSFTVAEDGYVKDVEVTDGLGYGCDEESIRVIENMPRWKPAIENGKAVSMKYTISLTFATNK